MENYKLASEMGQDLILTYLKNRMKEKKVTQITNRIMKRS